MAGLRVVVVAPVYDDWASAAILCDRLDRACPMLSDTRVDVLLVDDGSPSGLEGWTPVAPSHLGRVDALRLRRNLGHQRAITTGLCYVKASVPCDLVVVMDADGEDRPEDAVRLIQWASAHPGEIVFAERRKRLEGLVFKTGYALYRAMHRLLTGIPVHVGNFSAVPSSCLTRLLHMSELWNHYAGGIFKAGLPFSCVPMDRGERYCGASRMNVSALVSHGIAGIASFHDRVATRILIANCAAIAGVLMALVTAAGMHSFAGVSVPVWTPYVVGLLLILLLQFAAMSFSLAFTLIVSRTQLTFVPMRDYTVFVEGVENLWSSEGEPRVLSVSR